MCYPSATCYIVRDDAVLIAPPMPGGSPPCSAGPTGLLCGRQSGQGNIDITETGEVLEHHHGYGLINQYPTVCGMTGTAHWRPGERLPVHCRLGCSHSAEHTPDVARTSRTGVHHRPP